METEGFVEAALNYNSEKESLMESLCDELELPIHHIKSVEFKTYATDTKLHYYIEIDLCGNNLIKAENLAKTEGMSIRPPQVLVIECGVVDL